MKTRIKNVHIFYETQHWKFVPLIKKSAKLVPMTHLAKFLTQYTSKN